jgi:hypothetical protein
MNRISSGSMRLEKAIQGFLQSKQAEGCRDNTIITYTQQLGVWRDYAGASIADWPPHTERSVR